MAKFALLCAAIIVSATQCTVIRDEALKRLERSPCYTCGRPDQPPPPPPPVLQTENWTGLARSADGLQNAVFSGAAAAANQGAQTTGEAFSLASSTVNGIGTGLTGSNNNGAGSTSSADASIGAKSDIASGVGIKTGIAAGISDNARLSKGTSGNGNSAGGSYKEFNYSYHTGGVTDNGDEALQQNNRKNTGFVSSDQSISLGDRNKNIASHSEHSGVINEDGHFRGYHESDSQQVQAAQTDKAGLLRNYGAYSRHNEAASKGAGSYYGPSNSADNNIRDHEGRYVTGFQSQQAQASQFDGYGTGSSGAQSTYLGQDRAASGSRLSYQSPNILNKDSQEGHYTSGFQRDQAVYGSTSSSQIRTIGQHPTYREYDRGNNEAHYDNGRGDIGYQQSRSLEMQYGSSSLVNSEKSGRDEQQLQSGDSGTSILGLNGAENLKNSQRDGQVQFAQGDESSLKVGVKAISKEASSSVDAQSALSGALNLASQGLKTTGEAGCTTCGQGGYALSNAKSYSGSAVALSIGG